MDDDFGLPPARADRTDRTDRTDRGGHDEAPEPSAPDEQTTGTGGLDTRGRRLSRRVAAVVAAAALVIGGGAAAAYVTDGALGSATDAATSPVVGPSATAPPGTATSGTVTADPPRTSPPVPLVTPMPPLVPAVVPGWKTVEGREFVAYDVPPGWRVEGGDQLTGYEYHDPSDARLVVMHNVASYLPGVCPNLVASNRARTGFVVPAELGPREAAPELSARWASVAALDQGGRAAVVSPTQTVTTTIAGGTITATESTTLVSFPVPQPCQSGGMAFTAVSFEITGQVVVFMIHTDEQVADSLAPQVVNRIIASLRPVG